MTNSFNHFVEIYTKNINFEFWDDIDIKTLNILDKYTLHHESYKTPIMLEQRLIDLSFKLQNEFLNKSFEVNDPLNYLNTLKDSVEKLKGLFHEKSCKSKLFLLPKNVGKIKQVFLPGDHDDDSPGYRYWDIEKLEEKDLEKIAIYTSIKVKYIDNLKGNVDTLISNFTIKNSNHKKLKTNFSEDELALLFKLLDIEKKFDRKYPVEIIRMLTNSFTTKGTDSIDEDSIRNKFYSPSESAISNINALLINLRQQLIKVEEKMTR